MFSINLKTNYALIAIAIMLLIFAFIMIPVWKKENNQLFKSEANVSFNAEQTLPLRIDKKISGDSDIKNMPKTHIAKEISQIRTLAGTPAEAEVIQKWNESRGRFDEQSFRDYAEYDISTLKALADGGDIKAMIALANLYISEKYSSEYGPEFSMPLLKKAALYGSSYAMELYAITYESQNFVGGTSNHEVLLEALAWNNAAALRGDMYPNSNATLDLRRRNIQLNDSDIQKIRARSVEIYGELKHARKDLGLGDFDDNVPTEVKNFFSNFDSYLDMRE